MTGVVEPRANLPALTGIRGIAAWYVVLYHIRLGAAGQLPPEINAFLAKGYLAVDLFFILSGFVLWLNYGERLRREGPRAVPAFLARRIARIWPLHAFILGWAVLFALLLAGTGRADPEAFPWAELPLHLMLVQNWGFTDALAWNDPAWSISGEWAAYLLFPLLVLLVDWRALPTSALLGAILALAILLHSLMTLGGATVLDHDIPRFGALRALTEFTIGTLLCTLWTRWKDRPAPPTAASLITIAAFGGAWLWGFAPETLAVPLLLAALLMLVALAAGHRANPLRWRPVHYLGEISYSTYLSHFLLFVLFKLLFVDDASATPLPLLALFLLMTLIASILLFHLVEKPAQRALNRRFDTLLARGGVLSPAA